MAEEQDEPKQCASCESTRRVETYQRLRRDGPTSLDFDLCAVCAATHIGTTVAVWPEQHDSFERNILRAMAATTNMILEALEKRP